MTVYLLTKKISTFDKQLLEWLKKQLEGYEGGHTKNILSMLEKLSVQTDDKQLAVIQLLSSDEEKGLSLKKSTFLFWNQK